MSASPEWGSAIVKVGGGRGFVVEGGWRGRLIITAAHCLPHLPPAHAASYVSERTFLRLLGRIGKRQSIAATVAFVDPVGDIAVLEAVDGQAAPELADAYEELRKPVARS